MHIAFAVVVSSSLVVADSLATRTTIVTAEAFRDAGGATLIVTAADSVAGGACDEVTRIEGVTAAGAVTKAEVPIVATALPDAPIEHYLATDGFVELLVGGPPKLDGLVVSRDIAKTLGLAVGDALATNKGSSIVGAIFDYPSDGRRGGYGWAVVEVVDKDLYVECWATSWPSQPRLRSILLTTLSADGSASTSNPPTVSQLNATYGQEFKGAESWASRTSQFAPTAGLVLIGVFAGVMVWLRRIEVASNLHAGLRRRAMSCILLLEALGWVVPASLMVISTAVLLTIGMDGGDRWAIVWIGVTQAAGIVVGGAIGTSVAAAVIRERHLFSYFKNRT